MKSILIRFRVAILDSEVPSNKSYSVSVSTTTVFLKYIAVFVEVNFEESFSSAQGQV